MNSNKPRTSCLAVALASVFACACPSFPVPNALDKQLSSAEPNDIICNDELCEFTIKDAGSGSELLIETQSLDMITPNKIEVKVKNQRTVIYKFCRNKFSIDYAEIRECQVLYSCTDGQPYYSLKHGGFQRDFNRDGPQDLKHLREVLPVAGEFTVVP